MNERSIEHRAEQSRRHARAPGASLDFRPVRGDWQIEYRSVLFVEIAGQKLKRWRPGGTVAVVAHLGGGPNGAAIGPDDHCYICNNGGFSWRTDDGFSRPTGEAPDYRGGSIQRVNLSTGAVETLYTECDGKPLYGPNDLVFDAQGGFWFTNLGKKLCPDMRSAYITLSGYGQLLEVRWPRPGLRLAA